MAKQNLSIGSSANDGTGDSLRDGAIKLNSVIDELYTALGNDTNLLVNIGSPTAGQLMKWDGSQFAEGNFDTLTSSLDVGGFEIGSTDNGDVVIKPHGSGDIKFWAGGTGSALTYIDGADGKLKYTNHFAQTADLPVAGDHHGMFAHVHDQSHGYFAHDGAWVQLIDSGSSIGELTDVDMTVGGGPSDGQVLKWSATNSYWYPDNDATASGGGGGSTQNLFEGINADTGSTTASAATDVLTVAGGTNISTSIAGDTLTIDMTGTLGDVDQNLFSTIGSDSGSKTANSTTTTVNLIGGTGISTAVSGDNLTITNDSPNTDQNIFATVTGDSGTTTSNSPTESLAVSGGNGITTTASTNSVSIAADLYLASGQTLSENQSFITNASGEVEAVASAAVGFEISGTSGGGYDLSNNGWTGTGNPTIYVYRGFTYRFNNTTTSAHPFALRQTSGGSAVTAGVSGSQEGVQYWTVPMTLAAGTTYVYQCTVHPGMVGNLVVV
jgi:plastocyanin